MAAAAIRAMIMSFFIYQKLIINVNCLLCANGLLSVVGEEIGSGKQVARTIVVLLFIL